MNSYWLAEKPPLAVAAAKVYRPEVVFAGGLNQYFGPAGVSVLCTAEPVKLQLLHHRQTAFPAVADWQIYPAP
jgi:polyferredoxin